MNTNKSKSFKRKAILIALLIAAIAVTGFIFKRDISVKYYDLTHNHFKEGDKVYLGKLLFEKKYSHSYFKLYRLVRPISEKDIEKMSITDLEKATLINKIDPSLKPYLIPCDKKISVDSLTKAKSAYIGTFLYHKVLYFKGYHEPNFIDNAYAILPDYKGYEIDMPYDSKDYLLPNSNYTWADDAYYITANWTSDTEYYGFKH